MENQANFDSFIFTHIPKCGGSSFRNYLYNCGIDSNISNEKMHIPGEGNVLSSKNIPNLSQEELKTIRQQNVKIIADHSKYGVEKNFNLNSIENPFYYILFRDPIERFISHYNFFYYKLGYDGCKHKHFNELTTAKKNKLLHNLSNIQIKYLINSNKKSTSLNRYDLQKAVFYLKEKIHSFGLLENLDLSIAILKREKPDWLKIKAAFPVKNKTGKKFQGDFTKEDLKQIEKFNHIDIVLYEVCLLIFEQKEKWVK